uniref:Uncharacterized protein n=1 Tax=Mesocestoides corti TaxID=53468 RepID=A0A5K3G070_MESCO
MSARHHAAGSRTTGHVISLPRRAHYHHQYGRRLAFRYAAPPKTEAVPSLSSTTTAAISTVWSTGGGSQYLRRSSSVSAIDET